MYISTNALTSIIWIITSLCYSIESLYKKSKNPSSFTTFNPINWTQNHHNFPPLVTDLRFLFFIFFRRRLRRNLRTPIDLRRRLCQLERPKFRCELWGAGRFRVETEREARIRQLIFRVELFERTWTVLPPLCVSIRIWVFLISCRIGGGDRWISTGDWVLAGDRAGSRRNFVRLEVSHLLGRGNKSAMLSVREQVFSLKTLDVFLWSFW